MSYLDIIHEKLTVFANTGEKSEMVKWPGVIWWKANAREDGHSWNLQMTYIY